MGAVAAAVLGAPVSTTMIVFELTGGYALSIALLITVSIATGLTLALHGRSYFHWQLEMRGVFLQEGDHKFLVTHVKVAQFYHPLTEDASEEDHLLPEGTDTLRLMDNLETALKAFDAVGGEPIPVADPDDPTKILGWAKQVDALRYFNDLLIDTHAQEHR
jgi:CIC family chloride channel protein